MIAIDVYKRKLIQQIQIIDNEKTLNKIDVIINLLLADESVYVTTDEQKKLIALGLNDFQNGDYFNQDEIDNQDLKWLNEK